MSLPRFKLGTSKIKLISLATSADLHGTCMLRGKHYVMLLVKYHSNMSVKIVHILSMIESHLLAIHHFSGSTCEHATNFDRILT
jgi:hypothetical protein